YLAGTLDFDLGVMISASHNPYRDNGIKIFSGRGEKFGEAEERAVEAVVDDTSWTVGSRAEAMLEPTDLLECYLTHVGKLVPAGSAVHGARLALDMANGATTATAPQVFGRAGFELITIGDAPDGHNINLACGSTHPAGLSHSVLAHECRLGVAFDG